MMCTGGEGRKRKGDEAVWGVGVCIGCSRVLVAIYGTIYNTCNFCITLFIS